MNETKPAVRLRVWHRHGPEACGGVLFIAKRRFAPLDVIAAEDLEFPSGRVPMRGDLLACDACGAALHPADTDLLADLQDAGAYPRTSHEMGGRTYHAYSGDLDDDLTLADDEGAGG